MKNGYETYRNGSIVAFVAGIILIVFLEANDIKIGSAEASSMIGILIFLGPSALLGTIAKRKKKKDDWESYENDNSIYLKPAEH